MEIGTNGTAIRVVQPWPAKLEMIFRLRMLNAMSGPCYTISISGKGKIIFPPLAR